MFIVENHLGDLELLIDQHVCDSIRIAATDRTVKDQSVISKPFDIRMYRRRGRGERDKQ